MRTVEQEIKRIEAIKKACPYNGKWYKGISTGVRKLGLANTKTIDLHRFLAREALGKPIPPKVIVHHMNGDKNGGVIVICQNERYHRLLHVRKKAYQETGNPNKRKCDFCHQWDDISALFTTKSGRHYHRTCSNEYQKRYAKLKRIQGRA